MKINLNFKTAIIIILIWTLIVGTLAIIIFPEFGGSDASTYDGIAMNILEKGKFIEVLNQITPPLYPVFLAIVFFLFGHNYLAVYIAHVLILAGIGLLVFLIASKRLKLPPIYALAASILAVSWPYMLLFVMQRLTETLYIFWLTLIIYLLLGFISRPSLKRGLFLGLLFALAAHTRPVIVFLPFWLMGITVSIFLWEKIKKQKLNYYPHLKYGLAGLMLFVILCLPYSIYGTIKINRLVIISSNATDMYNRANKTMVREWQIYKTPGYEPGVEITLDKIIAVKIKNIYRFWESGADGTRAETMTNEISLVKILIPLYKAGYYIILFSAFFSWLFWKKNKRIAWLWLIVLYFWLIHTIIYPYPRYTLPIMPIIILLAVCNYYNILMIERSNGRV